MTGCRNVKRKPKSVYTKFRTPPGFDAATFKTLQRYIESGYGLLLVTGPTGSGKTTSLYAMLKEIDPEERSIQSIENPVEYSHSLWLQYEIPNSSGEGNEMGERLKGLLRNAPQVILIGEVRSEDVAKTLIDAANTGHLVFSTVHTNDAPSAISRLRKLGIKGDDLASVLLGVLAQRLVRCLCPKCSLVDERDDTRITLETATRSYVEQATPRMANDQGCENCNYTGYRGRRMIYELLDMSPAVRELIETDAPVSKIAEAGIKDGYSMWDSGIKLVASGLVSLDEVKRVGRMREHGE